MKIVHAALAVIAWFFFSLSAWAGEFQYECVVKQVFHVDNGAAVIAKRDFRAGQKFVISRETGEVVGGLPLNKQQNWKSLQVMDRGSKAQSFKLLAIGRGPLMTLIYVEVKEYEESKEKSFVFYDNFAIAVGSCT